MASIHRVPTPGTCALSWSRNQSIWLEAHWFVCFALQSKQSKGEAIKPIWCYNMAALLCSVKNKNNIRYKTSMIFMSIACVLVSCCKKNHEVRRHPFHPFLVLILSSRRLSHRQFKSKSSQRLSDFSGDDIRRD